MRIWYQLRFSTIPAGSSIQQGLRFGHTAADVYKPSYRPMPIAMGLLVSLRPPIQFLTQEMTYELELLSLGLSLLVVMS